MCFGVRDAIALARAQDRSPPLTILGDLAHNETVLAGLRARGIRMENRVEAVATPSVMLSRPRRSVKESSGEAARSERMGRRPFS